MKKTVAWLILCVLLLSSIFLAKQVKDAIHQENDTLIKAAMAEQLDKISHDIVSAMTQYNSGLHGLLAAVKTNGFDQFTYEKQLIYFNNRDYPTEFPGARGFGIIKYVEQEQLPQFLASAAAERHGAFELKQLSAPKNPLFIIQYIEPESDNVAALGLDIGSEPTRRVAALKAASTEKSQLTGPITLVQADERIKHGFLLLLAVYEKNANQTEKKLQGWVFAPLLISEIVDAVSAVNDDLKIEIADATTQSHINFYTSLAKESEQDPLNTLYQVHTLTEVFGRNWQITITPSKEFIASLYLDDAERIFWLIVVSVCLIMLIIYLVLEFTAARLQKLREQAAFANVVNNASDGIIGVDRNFAIVHWNAAANSLFGFTEANARGKPLSAWLTAGISADKLINYFKKVAQGESIRQIHFVYQSPISQRDKKLIFNISPLFQKREFWGATININDVTEINELQSKLELTNKELNQKVIDATAQINKQLSFQHSIIESDNSAIIAFNSKGTISLVNNSAIKLLSYTGEELIGKESILRLFNRDTVIEAFSANVLSELQFEEAMKIAIDKRYIPQVSLLRRKNGEQVKVKLTIASLNESEGFVLVAHDLSEKQYLENNIAIVNAAIDNAKELLLWINIDGSIYKANPYALQRLNYSDLAFKHLKISDVVNFKASGSWERVVNEILEKQQYTFEVNFRNAKGGWLQTLVSGCVINVDDQQLIYLAAKDIAQRVKEENELKTALTKADTANKAKTEFIANMSHELRTPLNAANGFLQLLQQSQLDEIQHKHIKQTKMAISSLTQTVDEILEVTFAEQNQLRLEQSDFVLDELLAEVGLFLYEMAGNKALEIHFKVAPDLPIALHGDKNKLKRILLNLGSNAVKFSNTGEVLIELSVPKNNGSHITLAVKVKDSGIGISQNKLNNIFEMFTQADNSSNRQYGGLGIGLTIANQYVNFLGGKIDVASELGKGSEFRFSILVQAATQTENAKLSFSLQAPINVLLVDDNQTSLSILGGTMSQLGWQVTKAQNADEALAEFQSAMVQQRTFDLALIDWKMPGVDGWKLAELIRKIAPVDKLPLLVMVTAHSNEMFTQNHSKNPKLLNGFITKPVTRAQLINAFYDAVASNKQTEQAPSNSTNHKPLLKMRILIVEDNPTNQNIAKALIESQGAITTLCSSGFDALTELENSLLPFDVVLMDIQMPGIDGYETTKRIRDMNKFALLPILAMTANVMPSDKEKCFAVGMNGHIGKPFELNDVVKQILLTTNRFENTQQETPKGSPASPLVNPKAFQFCVTKNINIQEALTRFNQQESIYLKSLELFFTDLKNYSLQFTDSNATFEQTKLTLHTLKSTAGALGFSSLTEQAKHHEQQLLSDGLENFVISAYFEFSAVCEEAAQTTAQLMTLLKNEQELFDSPQDEAEDFNATYQQLKNEVECFNMRAIDTFQSISGTLSSQSLDLASELIAVLNKLKFKEAKTILMRFDSILNKE
ncbi:response regulator [Flavobacterium sp. W21_SRS_FM6]|uniref:response regulator n=1 Tax=Flavobacterium sp. W21_SRS_FM6 TaxID=3240268 RepID=UPI003F91D413